MCWHVCEADRQPVVEVGVSKGAYGRGGAEGQMKMDRFNVLGFHSVK